MQWLIVAGGFPSIVILVFGFLAIAAAVGFAVRPDARKLPYLGALCAAVLCSVFAGVAVDLIAVSKYFEAKGGELGETFGQILIIGIGESLAPVVLGFSVLAVVALVSAIGLRRLSR
ncbi:hypothetical protein L6V77_03960 [Myxococcota bacterium]|jgi:hypothetical protein|nr:hypothetical protein [Myxococcota bacterium]